MCFLCKFHLVCLGVLPLLSVSCECENVLVQTARPLLQRLRFLPSRMGGNSKERVVMGDLYRHHRMMRAQSFVFSIIWQCVFPVEGEDSPDISVAGVASVANELALAARFGVQLLPKRGATTPSSQNLLQHFHVMQKVPLLAQGPKLGLFEA